MDQAAEKTFRARVREKILNRVYGIWFLRYAVPLLAVELAVLFLALAFFARFVFVDEVVSNALLASFGNPFKLIGYLWGAFLGTRFLTQLVIVAILAGGLFLLRDMNKSIIAYLMMRRGERRSD